VELALSGRHARVLDDRFAETPEYVALVLGVLKLLGAKKTEMLVLGLPVSAYGSKRKSLVENMEGHLGGESFLAYIEKVWVLPQPLGSYLSYMVKNGFDNSRRCLVIDFGFLTVDWLMCQGMTPLEARSGEYPGGMSAILREMAKRIGEKTGKNFFNITLLDRHLRSSAKAMTFHGERIDLRPFVDMIAPLLHESVFAVKSGIGTDEDLDMILLTGGSAWLFEDAVRRAFPGHAIIMAKDPVLGNVQGFFEAGRMVSER
jgi:plasmid segregation protein ParM